LCAKENGEQGAIQQATQVLMMIMYYYKALHMDDDDDDERWNQCQKEITIHK